MKKYLIILFYSSVYATSNNDLFTQDGTQCSKIEQKLYNKTLDTSSDDMLNSFINSINACIQGNTFSFSSHGWSNFITKSNQSPTLETDGDKYTLQYFKNADEINNTVADIDSQIQANQYKEQQIQLKEKVQQQQQLKEKQAAQAKLKKCNSDYLNSSNYKAYKKKRSDFLNNRYDRCIDNGYSSLNCYSFKLQDQIGYDMQYHPPANPCNTSKAYNKSTHE